MNKSVFLYILTILILSSCVSKKDFTALEERHKKTVDLLNTATVKLNTCLEEKATSEALAEAYLNQISDLKKRNDQLFNQSQDYLELTAKGAENLEKTLESIKEKDLKINRIQDALNRKDSVTFALVTSLKKEIGINDPDIEVNVDKAVVFISLSDKLLFKSGSYEVSERAREILGKVATVVNSKPSFECMVEGHTDDVAYIGSGNLIDNWDLSVKRATSIVRVLQELDVNPAKLIAAVIFLKNNGHPGYQDIEIDSSYIPSIDDLGLDVNSASESASQISGEDVSLLSDASSDSCNEMSDEDDYLTVP